MNTQHQTQAIEKQAQAIREIREEMVSELNELEGMNVKITRESVKVVADEHGLSELDALTMMQNAAAYIGDEETLEQLCDIKLSLVEAKHGLENEDRNFVSSKG